MPPPPKNNIEAIVQDLVLKKLHLFRPFPDLWHNRGEDLVSILVKDYLEQDAKNPFDPTRSKLVSWVNRVAGLELLNVLRNRYRMARHDKLGARPADDIEVLDPIPPEPETFEGEICGGDGKPLLVDFLGMVYRHARRLTAEDSRERRTYEPAQRLAVAAFARRYNMSVRETRGVFEDREDLRKVIGFPPLPSHAWFGRAIGAGAQA